jgi:ketosteroid isomerase-like protein
MTKTLTDETLVTQTVLDYFEGWFTGDVARMDRALHPDLVKRGPTLAVTTKERMLELTARGEGLQDGVGQLTQVDVEDVADGIASVTVRNTTYYEYVHLVRTPDGWKIVNALWRPQ